MSGKTGILLVALAVALAQPRSGRPAHSTVELTPEAARVARDFLEAFSRNDRPAMESMVPQRLENLYGPCPFARMPALRKPRADTRIGAIDFEGPMTDEGLPTRGLILLRYVEENGVRAWRVRQIYWYQELPPEADIPDRSPTAADRRQEPRLLRAAGEFIQAWLASDYERMDALTFHWWKVPRRPPKWVKLTGAELQGRPTALGGIRVDFVVKLRLLSVIPKRVHGNLWMVEEDGVWRVRPLTFTVWF